MCAAVARPIENNGNRYSTGHQRCLVCPVIDDEADITFTLKAVLEQSGFLLDIFNDPKIALSNFKPDYYDLILLDIVMPQMNGFELYQELKKKDFIIPIVVRHVT